METPSDYKYALSEYSLYLKDFGLTLELQKYANVFYQLETMQRTKNSNPSQKSKLTQPLGESSLYSSLEAVREDLGDCKRCKLCHTRNQIVFGAGNPKAKLMFVGEGPGADEDAQGLPFVGRAGQLLTKIIEAMGLTRDQVYIANVVKCRPPENRVPESDEVGACSPFLRGQIQVIKPQVIVALGLSAGNMLLNREGPISGIRGKFQTLPFDSGVQVMPTYHPAYLLRNPSAKKIVWEDMKLVMKSL